MAGGGGHGDHKHSREANWKTNLTAGGEFAVGWFGYAVVLGQLCDYLFDLDPVFLETSETGGIFGLILGFIVAGCATYSHRNLNKQNLSRPVSETTRLIQNDGNETSSSGSEGSGSDSGEGTGNSISLSLKPKKPPLPDLKWGQIPFLVGDACSHIQDNLGGTYLAYLVITKGGLRWWINLLAAIACLGFGGITFLGNFESCVNSMKKKNRILLNQNQIGVMEDNIDKWKKIIFILFILTAVVESISGISNYFYSPAQILDTVGNFDPYKKVGLSLWAIIFGIIICLISTIGSTYCHFNLNLQNQNTSRNLPPLTWRQIFALIGDTLAHTVDNTAVPILIYQLATGGNGPALANRLTACGSILFGALGAPGSVITCANSFRKANARELKAIEQNRSIDIEAQAPAPTL
jgi:hypothetical protein